MNPVIFKQKLTADELTRAEKRGEKAIIGKARIKKPDEDAINYYILEDGTEVCETDDGEAAIWPPAEPVAMAEMQE